VNGSYGLFFIKSGKEISIKTYKTNGVTDTKITLFDTDHNTVLKENDDESQAAWPFSKIIYSLPEENYPNLLFENTSISSQTANPGAIIDLSCTIKNNGNKSSNITDIQYYLSNDKSFNLADIYLGKTNVNTLSKNQSKNIISSITIPSNTTSGQKYILFYIDKEHSVTESNESDNVESVSLNINTQVYVISASPFPSEGGTISGSGSFNKDQQCTLTSTANDKYKFINWTENGTIVSTNNPYSFLVTKSRNLKANFKQQVFHISAIANPSEGGSITGTGNYLGGVQAVIKAIPNSTYEFVNWTEYNTIFSTDAEIKFNVEKSRDIVANFIKSSATNNYNFGKNISIFPNPFDKGITVSFKGIQESKIDINIYRVDGKPIYSIKTDINRNNIIHLQESIFKIPGIYLLKISTPEFQLNKKIIKYK